MHPKIFKYILLINDLNTTLSSSKVLFFQICKNVLTVLFLSLSFESRLWSGGLISYFRNKYFPSTDQCRVDAAPDSNCKPLTLVDLSPAFFVLGIGISLSILAFLLERINHYYFLIKNDLLTWTRLTKSKLLHQAIWLVLTEFKYWKCWYT